MMKYCSLCTRSRLFTRKFHFTPLRRTSYWNTSVVKHIEGLMSEYNQIDKKLMAMDCLDMSPNDIKEYSTRMHHLKPSVELYKNILATENEMCETEKLYESEEADLKSLVDEEMKIYRANIDELRTQLLDLIIPKDKDDMNNAILELRAGAGGVEASLFAVEIYSLYEEFSKSKNWKFELLSCIEGTEGGWNKVVASVSGRDVFGTLKHEVGVHRVQRVPQTETQGRLHTSTITVLVLPQPSDVSVVLKMGDVKVDTFKSSGAGGQHVNTTDSAVRLTHLPTGIVVSCQEGRSQIKNKDIAITVLTAKLYELERNRSSQELRDARKSQLGTGDRSERIRTYNFNQNRITDHRINETFHGIGEFLSAGAQFTELMSKLQAYEKTNALLSLSSEV